LDIGANIGIWTLLMAERCGDAGHVYAFEPVGLTNQNLHENVALSGLRNVTIFKTALGSEKGTVEIFSPSDPGRSSLARENVADAVEQVAVNRLEDMWKEAGRPRISFVKMDVEGAEPSVLEGGRELWRECKPITTCEINPRKLALMGKCSRDVLEFFFREGYGAFLLDEATGELKAIETCEAGDVVFMPEKRSY
jgi:FkbM family methyltransferase